MVGTEVSFKNITVNKPNQIDETSHQLRTGFKANKTLWT